MKARLKTVLKKNVAPWASILTCLLFVAVAATAVVMAENLLRAQDLVYKQAAGLAPID